MKKLYWKIRKRRNDIIFKIKAYFYSRRELYERRKDDVPFEKKVLNNVFKEICKNVLLIIVILIIEDKFIFGELCVDKLNYFLSYDFRSIHNLIINLNYEITKNIDSFISVLTAIVGIVGVFLGLYCANVMSIFTQKYADAPKKISQLFENDIITNKCITDITNYLVFSVSVLFVMILGIDVGMIMLGVCFIQGLKIIISFGFASRRTYQFSDIYYVTENVYRDIYKLFSHLNKGKLFRNDLNFQNHYNKIMHKYIQILSEVNDYNLEKKESSLLSIENFVLNNMVLLSRYWKEKSMIPFDSYWFDDKVNYKQWYKASFTDIEIALNTGTTIGYDKEKNSDWLEEEIQKMNDKCLKYAIDKKSFSSIYKWIQFLNELSKDAIESNNMEYYVKYLYLFQKKIQNAIIESNFSEEEEMALAEGIILNDLSIFIEYRKYFEKSKGKNVFPKMEDFEKKNWNMFNKYSNYFDIRKLHDQVVAEIKIEGRRITPEWYINQIFEKYYYDELLNAYNHINCIANEYIPEFADVFNKNKKYGAAVICYAKFSEIFSKIEAVDALLINEIDRTLKYYKEKSIIWNDKPNQTMSSIFDMTYKNNMLNWGQSTVLFMTKHWDDYKQFPDFLGDYITYLCELLIDLIIANDYEMFALNYKKLFTTLLLYQEYTYKDLMKIKDIFQQPAAIVAYIKPMIEYSEISAYAYLWGEILNDERWKEIVISDTKENIVEKDRAKDIMTMIKVMNERGMGLYNSDILRMNWKRRIDKAFQDSNKIKWRVDWFYEVYDGESQLLKNVIGVKSEYEFIRYDAYEIYVIVVLNQFVQQDDKYRSRDHWEDELYE